MHGTKVLAADGISGFANCGSEVISVAKYIQSYDFDEGDYRIPDD